MSAARGEPRTAIEGPLFPFEKLLELGSVPALAWGGGRPPLHRDVGGSPYLPFYRASGGPALPRGVFSFPTGVDSSLMTASMPSLSGPGPVALHDDPFL